MTITAIIVTHNSSHIILKSIASIFKNEFVSEIFVVDNLSDDSTIKMVKDAYPKIKVLSNKKNYGFGAACNQALKLVKTKYALLLNPDATISKETLSKLLKVSENNKMGAIIAPCIERRGIDNSSKSHRNNVIESDFKSLNSIIDQDVINVNFISGSIALWNMELMSKVGFFDESFFMFYEDDDISIRTKKFGYDLLLVKGLNVSHKIGSSSRSNNKLEELKLRSSKWSFLYIHKKHKGFLFSKYLAIKMFIKYSFLYLSNIYQTKVWNLFELSQIASKQEELFKKVISTEEEYLFQITERNSIFIEEVLKNHNEEKDDLLQKISDDREDYLREQNEILDNITLPSILAAQNKSILKACGQFLVNSKKFEI